MKLNNKGFAITAVLYGLLILFVILVSSYLLVLGAKKDRIDTLVNDIEKEYEKEHQTLAEYITELYDTAEKELVINNNISYTYAPSVNLMNDREGGTIEDHNEGNIRYYGSTPNNYIYFNCIDYENQSSETCELWRIVGVFEGKVKIIKNSSIGNFAWNTNSTNDWNTATLKDILNEGGSYYTELQTKNNKTLDLIEQSIWYINKNGDTNIYTNTSYVNERTGGKIWEGDIALAYPSDYGYASDLKTCQKTLYDYSQEECKSVNWMSTIFTENNYYWLITPYVYDDDVWLIYNNVQHSYNGVALYEHRTVPTLYLDTKVLVKRGTGTNSSPYQMIVF